MSLYDPKEIEKANQYRDEKVRTYKQAGVPVSIPQVEHDAVEQVQREADDAEARMFGRTLGLGVGVLVGATLLPLGFVGVSIGVAAGRLTAAGTRAFMNKSNNEFRNI